MMSSQYSWVTPFLVSFYIGYLHTFHALVCNLRHVVTDIVASDYLHWFHNDCNNWGSLLEERFALLGFPIVHCMLTSIYCSRDSIYCSCDYNMIRIFVKHWLVD